MREPCSSIGLHLKFAVGGTVGPFPIHPKWIGLNGEKPVANYNEQMIEFGVLRKIGTGVEIIRPKNPFAIFDVKKVDLNAFKTVKGAFVIPGADRVKFTNQGRFFYV